MVKSYWEELDPTYLIQFCETFGCTFDAKDALSLHNAMKTNDNWFFEYGEGQLGILNIYRLANEEFPQTGNLKDNEGRPLFKLDPTNYTGMLKDLGLEDIKVCSVNN